MAVIRAPLASPRVMIDKPLLAFVAVAGVTIAGCGSSGPTVTGSASSANWVTHADPVTLLPRSGEVRPVLGHASTPNRHDQTLNGSTVNASFGPSSPAAMNLLSGAAELSVTGPSGTQLYTQIFVFKTLAGARSLTSAFLTRTRLGDPEESSSGTPGEQGRASRQPYGKVNVSYRYAFRDQNVLCLVELDGPRGRYKLSNALAVAALTDRHIASALS